MKVFAIYFDGGTEGDGYGGGMAIVAANNSTEAQETMAARFNHNTDDDMYDEFSGWYCSGKSVEECPDLSTNLTEPKVIAFRFYRE